jgi:adenosylmethionine-8-amino-7-oxononanoate aminotransferase
VPSAAAAVGITPDVACYAKLLTAGMVPLAVTLARDEVFHAFDGDSKAQALLHGHSYTAHPLGCQVRNVGKAPNSVLVALHCISDRPLHIYSPLLSAR